MNNFKGVWRIVKWVYTTDRKPKALLQFPLINRLGEETLCYNNKEKAAIFIEYYKDTKEL